MISKITLLTVLDHPASAEYNNPFKAGSYSYNIMLILFLFWTLQLYLNCQFYAVFLLHYN